MTNKEIRTLLESKFRCFSLSKGTWTVKQSYYWGITQSGDHLFSSVQTILPNARLVDFGNHYHGFVGGAKPGTAQDSYFWAKFTVQTIAKPENLISVPEPISENIS